GLAIRAGERRRSVVLRDVAAQRDVRDRVVAGAAEHCAYVEFRLRDLLGGVLEGALFQLPQEILGIRFTHCQATSCAASLLRFRISVRRLNLIGRRGGNKAGLGQELRVAPSERPSRCFVWGGPLFLRQPIGSRRRACSSVLPRVWTP